MISQETADAILETIEAYAVDMGENWTISHKHLRETINSLVSEDEIRTMTPLEHQWMDYKEKTMAELVEVLANAQISTGAQSFIAGCMKEFLATLPSEKEIAKGQIEEYIGTDDLGQLNQDDCILIEAIFDWLDKEAE